MEPASLTLSVVALFTFVDNGISTISRARHFKKHASKLRAKILIEEARLHQWGRAWGYPDGDMDKQLNRSSPKVRDVVLVTLNEIANTLADVEIMKTKYGLLSQPEAAEEEPSDRSKLLRRATISAYSMKQSIDMIMPDLETPVGSHPLPSQPKIWSAGTWAVHGASKLKVLIDDLRDWNNGLHFFQPNQVTSPGSLSIALATEVLDRQDTESLQDIVDAAEDTDQSVLIETASLREYSIKLEEFHLTPLGNVTDKSLLLHRDRLKISISQQSNTNQSVAVEEIVFGEYQESADDPASLIDVLVEWKIVPAAIEPNYRFVSQMRIQKLARLLHASTKRPPGFRVLSTLGMVLGDDGSYGLVFRSPEPASALHVRLHEILPGSKRVTCIPFEPPLVYRIQLAVMLTMSFLQLHASSWLHRRFSARNVLFFPGPGSGDRKTLPEDTLSNPYITCFGFSRPAEDGNESISIDASQIGQSLDYDGISSLGDALYAHPASVGPGHVPFSRSFDIYALGFVLLEIGLWTSLDALVPSASRLERLRKEAHSSHNALQVIHDYVLDRYLTKLRVSIGGVFEEVVRWCLRTQFDMPQINHETLGVEFYWNVIWPLQQCKV